LRPHFLFIRPQLSFLSCLCAFSTLSYTNLPMQS
jgi:hypothetical protein